MARDNLIPRRDLRNHTAEVLRRVESGEHLVVTVSGRPVAELRPLAPRPHFASREDLVRILEDAPLDADFLRDVRAAAPDTIDELWPPD